jgi:hypothetical protein
MNICSTMLCFIMSDKKFLKEARNVFKEIQKDLISPEEEEIFKKVAERLNVSYETDKIEENKKIKTIKRNIVLDQDTLIFANQALLLRAILSNDMARKENILEFVKILIREEWKRLFITYENINNEMEKEKNK